MCNTHYAHPSGAGMERPMSAIKLRLCSERLQCFPLFGLEMHLELLYVFFARGAVCSYCVTLVECNLFSHNWPNKLELMLNVVSKTSSIISVRLQWKKPTQLVSQKLLSIFSFWHSIYFQFLAPM